MSSTCQPLLTYLTSDKFYPPEAEDIQLRTVVLGEKSPDTGHPYYHGPEHVDHNSEVITVNSQVVEHDPGQAWEWLEMAQDGSSQVVEPYRLTMCNCPSNTL